MGPTMNDKLTETQRHYQALQQQFRSRLPARLLAIIHSGKDWLATENSTARNTHFQQRVHDLAGSAGSYGFPEITRLCQKIEVAIQDNQPTSKKAMHTWLDQLQTFIK